MRNDLDEVIEENKCVYTFDSAKKIYLAHTASKLILLEKKTESKVKVFSLLDRNPVVISKDNGMLLFPRNK